MLKEKSNLIEATKEETKISEIEQHFQIASTEVSERICVVEKDITQWNIYLEKLNEIVKWVEEKKGIMSLPKPKEKDEIDSQKDLLEVFYNLNLFNH